MTDTSLLALRAPDGKRGRLAITHGDSCLTKSCIRCGRPAARRRVLNIDGKYQYRGVIAVTALLSSWCGPALPVIVPMLTFMSRISRDKVTLVVGTCERCDDWLRARDRTSRVMEGVAALLPLAGLVVGGLAFGVAGVMVGPLVGMIGTWTAITAIGRRAPDDRARVVSVDPLRRVTMLDVPGAWKDAVASDPDARVQALLVVEPR